MLGSRQETAGDTVQPPSSEPGAATLQEPALDPAPPSGEGADQGHGDVAGARSPSSATVDEVELAGALLHLSGPAFESLLARRGQGLSELRRSMMMAFSAALAGNAQRAGSWRTRWPKPGT